MTFLVNNNFLSVSAITLLLMSGFSDFPSQTKNTPFLPEMVYPY